MNKVSGVALWWLMGVTLILGGCGGESIDLTVAANYTAEVSTIVNSAETTVRFYYTYEGYASASGEAAAYILPRTALPTTVKTGENTFSPEWSTASGAGYSLSDKSITFRGVPLGKRNTRIAIELLQQIDGQIYVVAAYCYQYPDGELTEARLRTDLASGITLQKARTCGTACQTLFGYSSAKTPC